MILRVTSVHENARSALECGGLTPPCGFQTHTNQRAKQGRSASQEPSMNLGRKGGVKPPHSKVPSAQAFSWQRSPSARRWPGRPTDRLLCGFSSPGWLE